VFRPGCVPLLFGSEELETSEQGFQRCRDVIRSGTSFSNRRFLRHKGFPTRVLDFAHLIALQKNSRIIIAYHPTNQFHGAVRRLLDSDPRNQWSLLKLGRTQLVLVDELAQINRLITERAVAVIGQGPQLISIIFPASCPYAITDAIDLGDLLTESSFRAFRSLVIAGMSSSLALHEDAVGCT